MTDNPMQGNARPDPDPTILTTQQIFREITSLRDLIGARLDGMGTDMARLHLDVERIPTLIDEKVGRLLILNEEKFKGIQVQFTERDTRTEQSALQSKVALEAALQAAKEAVGETNKSSALSIAKSEASMVEQIKQLVTLGQASNQAQSDKIDDLKERLTRIEGQGSGFHSSWVILLGGVGALATVISIAAAVFAFFR